MATQVATSHTTHTQVHARAPLKVPKRPPRNDVTLAIQKFLPYVVVFLLSLIVYSSFKSSSITYPPYSPPTHIEEPQPHLLNFARDNMNRRAEILEGLKRRSEGSDKVGGWKLWMEQKAEELNNKLESANAQVDREMDAVKNVVSDMNKKGGNVVREVVGEGETMMGKVKEGLEEFMGESHMKDFAHDAMYAWKMKAKDSIENVKGTITAMKGGPQHARMSQAAYDHTRRAQMWGNMFHDTRDKIPANRFGNNINSNNNTIASRLAQLVDRVKSGLVQDTELHRAEEMKLEWDRVKLQQRTDMIVHQLRALGDEVVEEVFHKLSGQYHFDKCLDYERMQMCPKL